MQRTKKEWMDWANTELGLTKADAKSALANLSDPIEESEANRVLMQFLKDKYKQVRTERATARGQATRAEKEKQLLSKRLDSVEKQYEGVISSILGSLSFLYSWAIPKGLEPDPEIEEVLNAEKPIKRRKTA
jgi:hypothetical protein